MTTTTYRFGDFTLTASTRELRRGAEPIAISPRAFDCLAYLIEHRDRAVGKDELVAAIWERVDVSDTQLGQTVLRARRAVNDDGQAQNVIRTVSRFGYRWVADVAVVAEAQDGAASSVVAPLDESSSPARASTPTATVASQFPKPRDGRRAWLIVATIALALVLVASFAWRGWHTNTVTTTEPQSPTTAVVLPMHVATTEGEAWLRLGVMDLVAQRLRAGGLAVPPSENTVALLKDSPDDETMLRAIRRVAPSALIVSGDITHESERWTIGLAAVAADGTTLTGQASDNDALAAARAAADQLLGRLGRATPPNPPYANGVEQRLQRAQAAMLNNDLDAARAILISDPDLAHAEPELAYRLATVDFRAGEYARAESALASLLAEPAADDPKFRARVLDGRGAVRIRKDDYVGAEKDYDASIALLQNLDNAPELGRALTGRGVARAMRRDFAPALADLGQARVQLAEAGDALGMARVDTDQAALEMNRDRPQDAVGYLEKASAVFERYGAINELMETIQSLASNHMAMLEPAEALRASNRSWALAARVTDPNQRLNLIEDRVDAFLALGRFRDAAALLSTLPEDAPAANPFVGRRVHALRARLAFAHGDNVTAMQEASRALAMPAPSDDTGEGVAEIALVYQRAALANADAPPATAPAATWVDFTKPRFSVQVLTAAEWAAYRNDPTTEPQYRKALDLAEARGEPSDVGAVTDSFGPWLLANGRLEEAGNVIGRVAPWSDRDYDSALLQVRLFHSLAQPAPWAKALAQARTLAGERTVPADLATAPDTRASLSSADAR